MIIKKIESGQFAGLRDQDVRFEDGMNLLIGENEAGKSTIVDLLYHLFFTDAKLDRRSDKAFMDRYFPKDVSGTQVTFVDGEVLFETENGTYRLSKEWAAGSGEVKLTLPNRLTLKDKEQIGQILSEVLNYDRGVYDELVFASQRREKTILSSLLGDGTSDNMRDLASTLTLAVMETGGIDIDGIEEELRNKVASYEGHWDFAADRPENYRTRGLRSPWKVGVGSILNAFYARERIAEKQEETKKAELDAEEQGKLLLYEKEEAKKLNKQKEDFLDVRGKIDALKANRRLKDIAEENLKKYKADRLQWPVIVEQVQAAERLNEELTLSTKRDLFVKTRKLFDNRDLLLEEMNSLGSISDEDVQNAQKTERRAEKLESQLMGMNLTARIHQLSDREVSVKSSVDGNLLEERDGSYEIREAVEITVPGIVSVELSPMGVNMNSVRNELSSCREELKEILNKYGAVSPDELRERKDKVDSLSVEIERLDQLIASSLGDLNWESLSAESAEISDEVRGSQTVMNEIRSLGMDPVDRFIASGEVELKHFKNQYGDMEGLECLIREAEKESGDLEDEILSTGSVPAEFSNVGDPDSFLRVLNGRIERAEKNVEIQTQRLAEAQSSIGDYSAEEYAQEFVDADENFNRLKDEYRMWKHILDVFFQVKEEEKGNPLSDIEEHFRGYLSVLTDDRLTLRSISEDLGSSILSENNVLTADILSEGTKETVSLAFRLAVLEHLYPDGGCVAVFDDPFTEMDPRRTEEGCRLLQRFAEKNQVIFVTCDDKYSGMMNGNCVRMSR